MPGVMDMFSTPPVSNPAATPTVDLSGTQPAPVVQPAPVTTVQPNTTTSLPTKPVSDVAPGGEAPVDNSSLAPFSKIWEDIPIEENVEAPVDPNAPVVLDPKDVQEVVSKQNLASSITPEQTAAITAGGEEAAKALAEIVNSVAQSTLVQATLVSNKLAEQAIEKAIARNAAGLPAALRAAQVAAAASTANPDVNHPAAKPILDLITPQILERNPDATPSEVIELQNTYLIALGEMFAPKAASTEVPDSQNWEKYLNSQLSVAQ